MSVKPLRIWLEYVGFRCVTSMLQMLSARQTARIADTLGWLFVNVLPKKLTRYQIAYDNISRAFASPVKDTTLEDRDVIGPQSQISNLKSESERSLHPQPATLNPDDIHEMIRRMWVHLFRLIAETVQLPRVMTLTNCREIVVFRNRKRVLESYCSGRPVIVLGGHFGNWEVSTATFGLFGLPMGIVGRSIDNPLINDWFVKSRQATGHLLIDKHGAAPEMVALMEAGGNLGLLCDQDAGGKGMFVDFFGQPASTFKSIALMALQYNAILLVGYGIRLPDDFINSRWSRFELGCEEVIDPLTIDADDPIREITQRFTSALERAVRRAPEQYFWVHRRGKSEPRSVTRKRRLQQQASAELKKAS
ncbi:MAG: lysophospholipid acyltransferase family protein [Planctomycetaceae bacterium]